MLLGIVALFSDRLRVTLSCANAREMGERLYGICASVCKGTSRLVAELDF